MKTKFVLVPAFAFTIVCLTQCGSCEQQPENPPAPVTKITPVNLDVAYAQSILPGFNFPEDSMKIYSWLNTGDTMLNDSAIYAHAWGVWAGLTANSGEIYQGDTLRVFETWLGLGEIQSIIRDTLLKGETFDQGSVKTTRTALEIPRQHEHAHTVGALPQNNFGSLFVSVAYSPAAAGFAISNSIMRQDVINTFYNPGGIGYVKPFPNNSITLKPTYYVGMPTSNLLRIPVWPGIPDSLQSFSDSEWHTYVYADTSNSQPAGKIVVPVTGENPTPEQVAAATCNLDDFIHYEVDSAFAAEIDTAQSVIGNPPPSLAPGNLAILMCMHVATKEISNWTWQTFYWDPNPAQPKFPGSNLSKPSQLEGAPAHYSASTAYAMVRPNQPISGGKNDPSFRPVIGFNPYLEAVFGPSTFAKMTPNQFNPNYNYGVQTNCMSCHAMAAYTPNMPLDSQQQGVQAIYAPKYSTDQYIDMSDTMYFKDWVVLDFAWSLQAAIFANTATSNAQNK